MALQLAHPIRKAIVVVAVAAAAAAGGLVTAAPADAAYGANPYLDMVSSDTTCNLDTNTISFGTSIQLNSSLKNGAKVSVNFAFYQVDAGGRQTSTIYYHNGQSVSTNPNNGWSTPVFMDTWTQTQEFSIPLVSYILRDVNNLTPYASGSAVWAGRLQTQINVGVLVGSTWYTTGWLHPSSYTNFFTDSTGQRQRTYLDCYLDW